MLAWALTQAVSLEYPRHDSAVQEDAGRDPWKHEPGCQCNYGAIAGLRGVFLPGEKVLALGGGEFGRVKR